MQLADDSKKCRTAGLGRSTGPVKCCHFVSDALARRSHHDKQNRHHVRLTPANRANLEALQSFTQERTVTRPGGRCSNSWTRWTGWIAQTPHCTRSSGACGKTPSRLTNPALSQYWCSHSSGIGVHLHRNTQSIESDPIDFYSEK